MLDEYAICQDFYNRCSITEKYNFFNYNKGSREVMYYSDGTGYPGDSEYDICELGLVLSADMSDLGIEDEVLEKFLKDNLDLSKFDYFDDYFDADLLELVCDWGRSFDEIYEAYIDSYAIKVKNGVLNIELDISVYGCCY